MLAIMKVKIGQLRNNLSRYIHKMNKDGEVIIICDRDTPVACLSPLSVTPSAEWRATREAIRARALAAGVEVTLPEAAVSMESFRQVAARVAPDERVDINTVDQIRGAF